MANIYPSNSRPKIAGRCLSRRFLPTAYQTLADATEVSYQVNAPYTPGCERGLRYDDPLLDIHWPLPLSLISPKDKHWPAFQFRAFLIKLCHYHG